MTVSAVLHGQAQCLYLNSWAVAHGKRCQDPSEKRSVQILSSIFREKLERHSVEGLVQWNGLILALHSKCGIEPALLSF